MSVAPIMFSLIRSEICGTALEESKKNKLSAKVCKELFELSNKHDVAHIVASALFKNELLDEKNISVAFKKVFMMAVYRDSQREYSLNQISAILEKANVSHILLKGAILRKYYPQTWMRTSCDVDVLVKNEDIDCAINALCKAGYVRVEDASTHDYNLISPNKIHIELHYTLSQDGEFANADAIHLVDMPLSHTLDNKWAACKYICLEKANRPIAYMIVLLSKKGMAQAGKYISEALNIYRYGNNQNWIWPDK